MEELKRIGLYSIGIFVFVASLVGFFVAFQELYQTVQREKDAQMEETVQAKTVDQTLFGRLTYYVVFEEGAEENATYNNMRRSHARVSQSQFEDLSIDDKIEGSWAGAAFTDEGVRAVVYENLIVMGVFLVYPVLFILYQLIHIPAVGRWMDRNDKWLGKLVSGIFIGVICIVLLFIYILMGRDIINTIQAHSGNQQEVEAVITDKHSDINLQRYARNYFYLALTFEDQDGTMIHMTKEVPQSVYYDNDFSVKVSYPEGHPYRAHIVGFNASDITFYGRALTIYGVALVLTVLLIYAAYLMNRKKQTGSFWPDKRDGK